MSVSPPKTADSNEPQILGMLSLRKQLVLGKKHSGFPSPLENQIKTTYNTSIITTLPFPKSLRLVGEERMV